MATITVITCSQCNGIIPTSSATYVANLSATLVSGGTSPQTFTNLDFCCTEHMIEYVNAQVQIPPPDPPYPVLP